MNAGNSSPSKLEKAIGRVHGAVDKLENSMRALAVDQDRQERSEQHLRLVVDENTSLKSDQKQLNEAIDLLQDQYDDLHKVAANIYGKLDDSVRRITKIIGN